MHKEGQQDDPRYYGEGSHAVHSSSVKWGDSPPYDLLPKLVKTKGKSVNLLTSCPEGKVKVQNMIPYDLSAGKRSEEPPLLRPTGTEPRPGTSFGISPDLLPNLAKSQGEM